MTGRNYRGNSAAPRKHNKNKYSESSTAKSVCSEGSYRKQSGEDERLYSAVPEKAGDIILCSITSRSGNSNGRMMNSVPGSEPKKKQEIVGNALKES